MMRRSVSRPDDAVPRPLLGLLAATLAMVVALVLLLQDGSDWVGFVAIGLVPALGAFVVVAVGRGARQDEQPEDGLNPDVRGPGG
jgi:hypothetical protein